MRISEIPFPHARPIDGYGPGFFRIGGERVEGALLLTASGLSGWKGPGDSAPLLALAGEIDVLLVGTGAEMTLLPPDLRAQIEAAGIGVESMSTPAACRSFNVLLAEGRRVAAALLPV